MNYKIIAMDFDGTLFTSDKKVTKKTKKALLKYQKNGYIIVGATARGLNSVKSLISDISMFNYLILTNGCHIYDVKNKKAEYIGYLDKDVLEKITEYFKDISEGIDYRTLENYYMYRKNETVKSKGFLVGINSLEEIKERVSRLNIYIKDYEDAEKYRDYVNQKFPETNAIVMQDTDQGSIKKWIAINPKDLNKLVTLEKLCKRLNINMEEVIFFGDGPNDIEIIEKVGLGVAMGNALPEVKEKAKEITLSNNEDGIAIFLESL